MDGISDFFAQYPWVLGKGREAVRMFLIFYKFMHSKTMKITPENDKKSQLEPGT